MSYKERTDTILQRVEEREKFFGLATKMLSKIKVKELHFAWDKYQDKKMILPKFKLFSKHFNRLMHGHRAVVYTLVNFDTTLEQDLERIYTLRDMGYWAYVMVYDKEHCDPIYKKLQRWVNMRSTFAKIDRFEDYTRKKQIDLSNQLSIF